MKEVFGLIGLFLIPVIGILLTGAFWGVIAYVVYRVGLFLFNLFG